MKKLLTAASFLLQLMVLGLAFPAATSAQNVIINEIMFHPILNRQDEEFIELYNPASAPVTVAGWKFERGVDFIFPPATIPAGGYLVVAADTNRFRALYPTVSNIVGNWTGTLNNSRQTLRLVNAAGQVINELRYADEGDWAIRKRGEPDRGHLGWDWLKEADGLGKSLELRNPSMPNVHGQNWGASTPLGGTPGAANSIFTANIPPLILNVTHFPAIPRSTNSVNVVAAVIDELPSIPQVTLFYRLDSTNPPPWQSVRMFDDGQHQDGVANDKIFGAAIPPATSDTVVEFHIGVGDVNGSLQATYPAPAILEDGVTRAQSANLLYQVDDRVASPTQPLYKLIMRETERAELAQIGNGSYLGESESNAEMNGTFISVDASGTELRYLVGIRNRGHGSRNRKPNNYRVNFRSDDTWKGVEAINLNGQFSYMQHVGAVLSLHAGVAGAFSTPVQVRVNNADLSLSGGLNRSYGSYVANEVLNSDWAEAHFPNDPNGNIYRGIRDLGPADLAYRGTNWQSYTNSYFKSSNTTENDWSDLIRLTDVLTNTQDADYERAVREVANVEQWLRHLAVMALLDSRETGLNTGNGDDYFMYRGIEDPRFNLIFYDLDTILGLDGSSTNGTIFGASAMPAFARLFNFPKFRSTYFGILNELINTTFSQEQFNGILDQTLRSYLPESAISRMKVWMDGRREYVRSLIAPSLPSVDPRAILSGLPRSPTPLNSARLQVSGEGVTHYKFQLNDGPLSEEIPVTTPLDFTNMGNGLHLLRVFGRNSAGDWQVEPTIAEWIVDVSWLGVRINEVLASNRSSSPRNGAFPDLIELYNESGSTYSLAGCFLAKGTNSSVRYFFPSTTVIPSRGYLVLTATDAPASASNTGFTLDAAGDALVLYGPGDGITPYVADHVEFGAQLPDLSIARLVSGEWTLARPTIGTTNVAEPTGPQSSIVINEWLAAPETGAAEFIELFNNDALPVNIGGLYLTDQPIGWPDKQRIPPNTFVAGRGYLLFGANTESPLAFQLKTDAGEIALMNDPSKRIDSISYTAERIGISSGRTPDGAATLAPFVQPTPGGPNSRPDLPPTAQLMTLIPMTNRWKYDESGSNLGTSWSATNYNDSAWSSGPALLGDEDATLAEPIRTRLSVGSQKRTFYFRTKFVVDPSVTVSGLQMNHYIDDGAIFYLNGQEIGPRYNMLPGAPAFDELALNDIGNARLQGPHTWPIDLLLPGENTLAVEVHQYRSSSSDVVFGLSLDAIVFTNDTSGAPIALNEILTQNSALAEPDGSTPDWIELYNPSTNDLDLAGFALTDDPAVPRKWVFPSGSVIRGHGYFSVAADADKLAARTNTGFGLQASGGGVFLHAKESDGGSLLDSIRYGLLPQDFSLGRTESGEWTLNLPTIGRANTPANLGSQSSLRINEWLANPRNADDWFEIYNPADLPVDLSGLLLSDDPAVPAKTVIPARSYIGVGQDRFIQFIADQNVENGPKHVNFRLSSASDRIVLSRPDGTQIDAIAFTNQVEAVSEGRLPDGASQIVRFAQTSSPGHPNFLLLTNIVINEILTHTDPPLEDAVELFNSSAQPLNIGGWFLSDDQDDPRKFALPAGTTIAAAGFKVFYENQFNPLPGDPGSFSFSSANGDSVILSEALSDGTLTGRRAIARFGPAENGVSFGLVRTSSGSDYAPLATRTFGRDIPQNVTDFRQGTGSANSSPKVGPVIISEVMFFPPALGTNDNVRDEFIEIQNTASFNIPLYDPAHPTNRWRIRGAVDFDFPAIQLPAGGTLVITSFDPANDLAARQAFRDRFGTAATLIGPYVGKLGNEDDTIELLKPDAPQPTSGDVPYILVETVDYTGAAPWPNGANGSGLSIHRQPEMIGQVERAGALFPIWAWTYANEPLHWLAQPATPGIAEGTTAADQDGDSMADDWERANGFDPLNPNDASLDVDGDGLSNLAEFILGTAPRDAASTFKASVRDGSSGTALLFNATEGRTYSVLARNRLDASTWAEIARYPAGPAREIVLPLSTSGASQFLRVVTPALQ